MNSGTIYRNSLQRRCPTLRNNAYSYKTSLNMLCHLDRITVQRRIGGGFSPGPTCGLGMFVPISAEELAVFKENRGLKPDDDKVEPELVDPEVDPEIDAEVDPEVET